MLLLTNTCFNSSCSVQSLQPKPTLLPGLLSRLAFGLLTAPCHLLPGTFPSSHAPSTETPKYSYSQSLEKVYFQLLKVITQVVPVQPLGPQTGTQVNTTSQKKIKEDLWNQCRERWLSLIPEFYTIYVSASPLD